MKFRIKTNDIGCIQHFLALIHGITYLSKNFVMRISSDFMYFIINERVSNGSSLYWCQINYRDLFLESEMRGLSVDNNEIILEVISDYLLKSLRQVSSCRSVKIKLIKNRVNNPCLSIEIEQSTSMDKTRFVMHEVPVRIVPLRIWNEYLIQPAVEFDISIYLPNLKTLRSILDKMKNLTGNVTITANSDGELLIEIRNDQVKVRTQFTHLTYPVWKVTKENIPSTLGSSFDSDLSRSLTNISASKPKCQRATVTVDIRRMFQLINSLKIIPDKLVCNIVDHRCLQIYATMHGVVVHGVIPGIVV